MTERQFDVLLETSIKAFGQDYIVYNGAWEKPHEFSRKFERNMQKLIRKQPALSAPGMRVPLRRLIVIAVAAILLLLTLTLTVGAQKELFMNFYIDVFDTHSRLRSVHEENVPTAFEEIYVLSEIPEGFVLDRQNEATEGTIRLEYEYRSEEAYIFFAQHLKANYDMCVNTEGHEMQPITVNGYEGFLVVMNEDKYLLWDNGEYLFSIATNVSEDALIEMSKTVQKVE